MMLSVIIFLKGVFYNMSIIRNNIYAQHSEFFNDSLIHHETERLKHSLRRRTKKLKYTKRIKLFTNLWGGFSPLNVKKYDHALKTCSSPCKNWDNDDGEVEFRLRKAEKAMKKRLYNINKEIEDTCDDAIIPDTFDCDLENYTLTLGYIFGYSCVDRVICI